MLSGGKARLRAARWLFWASPLGPMIATLIWIWSDHPSLAGCELVSGFIGATTTIALLELLRWVETHEGTDK